MRQIKFDIPDCVPVEAIEELEKQIKDLGEPQLKVYCESIHSTTNRTLYINYPSTFEAKDIIITGILVGACLFSKQWKEIK